jgi:hypothetical protein
MRRILLAATAGLLLAPAPAADARVRFHATTETRVVHFPRTKVVEYRLHMRNDGRPAQFRVDVVAPRYRIGHGRTLYVGWRQPRLVGTGRLIPMAFPVADCITRYHPPGTYFHHFEYGYGDGLCGRYPRAVTVQLAPNARATLVVRAGVGRSAPRLGTDFRLRWVIALGRVFRSPQPRLTGARGVVVKLDARQPRVGETATLSGTTAPAVRNGVVLLRVAARARVPDVGSPVYERTRVLARVRTDAYGRFRYDGWTARWLREYHVWAETPPQPSRGLVGDRSDFVTVRVRP